MNPTTNTAGYSIVENLMAMVILVIVIVPVCGLIARLAVNQPAKQLTLCLYIAQAKMEQTLHLREFRNDRQTQTTGRQTWVIDRTINKELHRMHITIRVKRIQDQNWRIALYTCRPVNIYQPLPDLH